MPRVSNFAFMSGMASTAATSADSLRMTGSGTLAGATRPNQVPTL